jgi:preprotein translocase subunit SecY
MSTSPWALPGDKAPPILKHLLQLFECRSKSKQLQAVQLFFTWLVLTGLCTALAALVVYFWALDNHDQSDLDTVNDLGQAYAVLIGLILSVYLERSVEKRRRVALAHENKNEAEKRANDKEAIPNAFTALVFAIILIYSSVIFPLQRLGTGSCEEFPCHEVLKVILVNVVFVAGGNLLVFLVAFSLQFVALELGEIRPDVPTQAAASLQPRRTHARGLSIY